MGTKYTTTAPGFVIAMRTPPPPLLSPRIFPLNQYGCLGPIAFNHSKLLSKRCRTRDDKVELSRSLCT